jgi:serine/threonine-protein kinase
MKLTQLGPYRLERILGRGGMGAVYVGLNQETGERAAVKVLNPVLADDASFRERFKSEIETLKKLLHPHIVQLFGYGEQDDYLFYVMELVEGRSLQEELLAGRRFNWREAARLGIEIAGALKHAHDRGVIHRDLKPANLLLNDQDHVKLTDFGIAKLYGGIQLTSDGGVLGTADYMSPEQAEGKQVTSRCDLYSLGSVLYALLAGRPPFSGKSLPEVIQGLRFERAIPIRRLNPDVPVEFETIIQQLLEKDPQKRIPTAVAVSNRLKAMEHALSVETRIAGPIDLDASEDQPPPAEPAARQQPGVTSPIATPTAFSTAFQPTRELEPGEAEPVRAGGGHASAASAGNEMEASDVTGVGSATQVPGDSRQSVEPTIPAAKKTVFTAVSPSELRKSASPHDAEELSWTSWIATGVLLSALVVMVGAAIVYATRPPSADALYSRIQEAAESDRLLDAEMDIKRFLSLYPRDPRTSELKQQQEFIDLSRLERQFERQARQRSGGEPLPPVVAVYLEAVRLRAGDPEAALTKFRAIVALYADAGPIGTSEQEQRTSAQCLELARQQIQRLEHRLAESAAAQTELVKQRLAEAANLAPTDRAKAERIWQAIIDLYGDKPWAKDLVAQAKAQMGQSRGE